MENTEMRNYLKTLNHKELVYLEKEVNKLLEIDDFKFRFGLKKTHKTEKDNFINESDIPPLEEETHDCPSCSRPTYSKNAECDDCRIQL